MPADLPLADQALISRYQESRASTLEPRELLVEGVSALLVSVIAIAMAFGWHTGEAFSLPTAAALIVGYAAMSRVQFSIGFGYTAPTELVFVPMLILLPAPTVPLAIIAGNLLAGLPDLISRSTKPERALFHIGDSWHAVGPAIVLALAVTGDAGWSDWPAFTLALAAQFLFDGAFTTVREWLAVGVSPRVQPAQLAWIFLVDLLLFPIGLLAALAGQDAALAPLAVAPLAVLLAIFARERQRRIDGALELNRAYRGTTLLLSDVLEADDEYTGQHSRSVVSLAVGIADEMGLTDTQRRGVEFGALLHDVGKIAVPSEIINKPGPLTDEEWTVIKAHTVEGQRMLDQVGGVLSEVGRIVRSSHERWDGGGYPDGLKGEEIPLESAIVCAADAFNAITTDRAYKKGRPPEEALAELLANSGTQFRPDVVDVLTRLVEEDLRARGARIMGAHEPQLA